MKIVTTFHPTPFCNLNCKYCWAPNRSDTTKMTMAVVQKTLDQVYANAMLDGMDVLWLTGEPLVLGLSYFEQAVERCLAKAPAEMRPQFIVQTNGTLIDDAWCEFFLKYDFVVGVSVDGPAAIHDRQRLSLFGGPTFQRVERGIDLLIKHGVRGGAICVITRATLTIPPDELFGFFQRKAIAWSYLIEGGIGENARTTGALNLQDRTKLEHYLDRLLDLWARYPDSYIRDFEQTSRRVFGGARPRTDADNLGCLDILNVSARGDFYWGNPELLCATEGQLTGIRFNLERDDVWRCRTTSEFVRYQDQIHRGVQRCLTECTYFEGCQGGNPAHKFYEHGTFDASVHTSCQLNDQLIQTLMTRKLATRS